MKSVMISIKPKWCELIARGKKTVEVKKTKPKIEAPFKCYIYETKDKTKRYYDVFHENTIGKVIGEFICDDFYTMIHCGYNNSDVKLMILGKDLRYKEIKGDFLNKCQLSYYDIEKYSNGRNVYGWHISDLVIYDKPKVLSEFYKNRLCCKILTRTEKEDYILTRPPKSWRYCEEMKL